MVETPRGATSLGSAHEQCSVKTTEISYARSLTALEENNNTKNVIKTCGGAKRC